MTFTPEQIATLELLFKLTPAQRNKALTLAVATPRSPATPRVKGVVAAPLRSPSTDSKCTEYTARSDASSSSSKSGKRNRQKIE